LVKVIAEMKPALILGLAPRHLQVRCLVPHLMSALDYATVLALVFPGQKNPGLTTLDAGMLESPDASSTLITEIQRHPRHTNIQKNIGATGPMLRLWCLLTLRSRRIKSLVMPPGE
jgi:hypothetical protein